MLADKIIVLSAEGKVAQQGSYQELRSVEGFVHNVSSQERRYDNDIEKKEVPQVGMVSTNAVQGPSADQLQDLTRRTGDLSVYRYYFKAIKNSSFAMFLAANVVYAFCYGFLRMKPFEKLKPVLIYIRVLVAEIHQIKRTKYSVVHWNIRGSCIRDRRFISRIPSVSAKLL